MRRMLIVLSACFAFSGLAYAAVPVDINHATQAQLESIRGVGPVRARAIIAYRSKHGPFKNVDELDHVKGFGKKSVAKIRPRITVRHAFAAANAKGKGMKR